MDTKPNTGTISESYSYAIDGEYCSGYKQVNVKVTKWWGKGELFNQAKEVETDNKCYRCTKKNGWRQFDKISKKYIEKRGIGLMIVFTPNTIANSLNNYDRVNLGGW